MFILHVKHYFFQEILKVHSLQKKMQNQHFITFTSGKLQDFWSSGFGFRQGLRQRSVSRETEDETISFPEHARSQVKGGHSSGEIELIQAADQRWLASGR
jgi:hypothetical protein